MEHISAIATFNKPIIKLIDNLSTAIGKVYEPKHLKRMADAEAYKMRTICKEMRNNIDFPITYDGSKMLIDSNDTEEILKRVGNRVLFQEINKQQNVDSVIIKTCIILKDKNLGSEENIDKDWLLRYIASVEDISNEEMQKLWAKILAGEVLRPNSYSLRTLNILRNLTQNEAELFSKICNYVIPNSQMLGAFVYNDINVLEKHKILYKHILKLGECGLINSSGLNTTVTRIIDTPNLLFRVDNFEVLIEATEYRQTLLIEEFPLTEAGKELYDLVDHKVSREYLLDIAASLMEKNQKVKISVT